jgi:hypothetical protein
MKSWTLCVIWTADRATLRAASRTVFDQRQEPWQPEEMVA